MDKKHVFIIGSTGFMGRALSEALLRRGHSVDALVRPGSERKAASGAKVFTGNPLDSSSYASQLKPTHTLVQLAGVAHPGPFKKDLFQKIDFVCGRESVLAARAAGIANLVYVSVAQPAPIMQAYINARAGVEKLISENRLNATVLRPWYVLGPRRRWPLLIFPVYWLMELFPTTRASARRLGFVTLDQMVGALVAAVESPAAGVRVWEVPEIISSGTSTAARA